MTTRSAEQSAEPRMHPHHPLRWLLVIGTLVAASVFLAPKAHEAIDAVHRASSVSLWWLLVALLGEAASLIAFSLVTYALIPAALRPRFLRVFRLDLVTVGLSHAVPAGSAAGTALGYGLLAEEGVEAVPASFAKVLQSVVSGAMLQLLLWICLGLEALVHPATNSHLALSAAGGAMLVLMVAFAITIVRRGDWTARMAGRLLGWIPRLDRDKVYHFVRGLEQRAHELRRDPKRLAWVCFWSMGNWVFDLISLWAALRAFGVPCDNVRLTIAFCLAQVAGALPISPGGLGLIEGSLVALLGSFGTPSSVAVLGTLVWRLFNFWLPLPVGLLAYLAIVWDRRRGILPVRRGAGSAVAARSAAGK